MRARSKGRGTSMCRAGKTEVPHNRVLDKEGLEVPTWSHPARAHVRALVQGDRWTAEPLVPTGSLGGGPGWDGIERLQWAGAS